MARRSRAFDALSKEDLDRLTADLLGSDDSWPALAKRYGVPESTLRDFANRRGIVRNPTGLKRQLVQAAMARPDPPPARQSVGESVGDSAPPTEKTAGPGRSDVEAAAEEDARDMRIGLQAARIALSLVGQQLQAAYGPTKTASLEPREVKILSESIAINVATIRLIRGLDAPFTSEDLKRMSDEQLQDIIHGRAPR